MQHIVAALLVLFLSTLSLAQTVSQRVRLGHSVEDIDTIGNQIVVIDGYEVFAAGKKGFTKILDVRDVGATNHVNSFTWIDSEKLFAFIEPADPTRMLLADAKGAPQGSRTITYAPGFSPAGTEGITWLPKGTPFADHLALVAYDDNGDSRIEIMTRDGIIVHEIVLAPPLNSNYVGSVDVFGPAHLVVALLPNEIYVIDYAGVPVSGPAKVLEAVSCEGVVRTPGGVAVADYFSGRIFALDTNLERQPENDLHNAFGVKLNPDGIAWNSYKNRYIVTSISADINSTSRLGFTLPISLDDPVPSLQPSAHGFLGVRHVTYMPDEHKILLSNSRPAKLLIYAENAQLLEQIDVASLASSMYGTRSLTSAVYVPASQEFYLRFAGDGARLRVVSRIGEFLRDIDLSATGATGFTLMTLAGDHLVLRANEGLIRTDLNGALLASYDTATLRTPRLAGLTAITTGPNAGKFAVCDSSGTDVVVFTLP